jgi:hypothetical protein
MFFSMRGPIFGAGQRLQDRSAGWADMQLLFMRLIAVM